MRRPLLGPTVKLAPAPRRTRSDPIHVVSDPRVGGERRLAQRQRIKLWAITTVHKAEALPLHPGMVFEMVLDHRQEPVQRARASAFFASPNSRARFCTAT